MSYIIALVKLVYSEQPFPVECFRTDLAAHDQVVVRLGNGRLRYALVVAVKYLNWDCKGRIECKASESTENHLGEIILPYGSPINMGITTHAAFVFAAKGLGCIPLKPSQRTYRNALGSTNETSTAYIFIRRNGIDIKIIETSSRMSLKPYSLCQCSLSDGITVRHSLSHTTFNLFEGILRFCRSFVANEQNLERYFVPVGSSDKRTEELKAMSIARQSQLSEMQDIYDACSDGEGGPAYLGDGMWITTTGRIGDEGR